MKVLSTALTLSVLSLSMMSAQAADIFECKLISQAPLYRASVEAFIASGQTQLALNSLMQQAETMKAQCARNLNEASCSRSPNCVGVYIETQQTCRTEVTGMRDSRTNEQMFTNDLGAVRRTR